MGLFDRFKKNIESETAIQSIDENRNNPTSNNISQSDVGQTGIIPYELKLSLHDDLNGLIWVADGKFKNYNSKPDVENYYTFGNVRMSWTFSWTEEPSLIYSNLSVQKPKNDTEVPRPSYWPTYKELSPEQKWVYLKLLSNPYTNNIDIGFVFILYYGLERHLLAGDFDNAFDTILKLRDVHTNKSFQSYSANALILTAMMHQRGEKIIEFISSLDKDYELHFSDNLFLICYYSFKIPIEPKDIMRMAKTFEFTNNNYIKKYPELFEESLLAILLLRFQKANILLSELVTTSELSELNYDDTSIFANMSIINETIKIPRLCDNLKLKTEINQILNEAHEMTKNKIQLLRKNGNLEETSDVKTIPVKPKKGPIDPRILKELPETASILNKHFHYIEQIKAFYERRDEDEEYLKKAIEACLNQIAISQLSAEAYVFDFKYGSIKNLEEMIKSEEELTIQVPQLRDKYTIEINRHKLEMENIKNKKWNNEKIPLPEHTGYKQLCIIYDKQGNYSEIIRLAEEAKKQGWNGDWDKRIENARKKI